MYIFILVNGTQLVGKVSSNPVKETFITVKKPRIVAIVSDPNNSQQQLIRLLPPIVEGGAKDEVILNMDTVAMISDPSLDMIKHYEEITSGIDLTSRIQT